MTLPLLFTPWTKRGVTLKNRVVVAPMHQYAAEKGFATDWHLVNAGRYAAGGAGLVFLGGRHEMCEVSGCHGHCFHEPPRERCLNCAVSAGGCSENIISPAPEGDTG